MKAIVFMAVVVCFLCSSCGNPEPDNKMYASDSTLTGWYATKPVYQHTVLIKPTWSQSFHYAKESGWGVWLVISIILFIAFIALFYGAIKDELPKIFDSEFLKFGTLFILLSGAIASFISQPGSIKGNNDHWVPKDQYEKCMAVDGNTTKIWDSLANNCHMNWGPDKGCKK